MKKLLYSLLFLLLITGAIFLKASAGKTATKLISPSIGNKKVLGINVWLPSQSAGNFADAPKVSAKSAFFIDSKSGEVLFSKDPHQKLTIASLVKVMTILIALEYKNLDDTYSVSQRAAKVEPDKMLLIAGEKLTLKELLYGIFLVSANDAAEVLAEGSTGARDEFTSQSEGSEDRRSRFIKLMNDKAKQLDMRDTYFANPTGLDEDNNNSYSTTYDLTILTRYLVKHYPQVVNISETEHIFLPQTETHQDYDMYSGINLLTTYTGVVGFKTGYTPEAGLTLITLARKGEHEVIGVLLGSGDRRDEARELLDYSFKKLGV